MRTLVRFTLVVAGLVLLPTAAQAAVELHRDATGEVVSAIGREDPRYDPAPAQARGDIASIRVAHLDRSVRVLMHYRALNASGQSASHGFAIRTATGLRFIDIRARPGRWAGVRRFQNANGALVPCRGISHTIDYARNSVLLVVPRSCLGNPRWVRVAGYSAILENGHAYLDDSRTTGYSNRLYLGPRVYL